LSRAKSRAQIALILGLWDQQHPSGVTTANVLEGFVRRAKRRSDSGHSREFLWAGVTQTDTDNVG